MRLFVIASISVITINGFAAGKIKSWIDSNYKATGTADFVVQTDVHSCDYILEPKQSSKIGTFKLIQTSINTTTGMGYGDGWYVNERVNYQVGSIDYKPQGLSAEEFDALNSIIAQLPPAEIIKKLQPTLTFTKNPVLGDKIVQITSRSIVNEAQAATEVKKIFENYPLAKYMLNHYMPPLLGEFVVGNWSALEAGEPVKIVLAPESIALSLDQTLDVLKKSFQHLTGQTYVEMAKSLAAPDLSISLQSKGTERRLYDYGFSFHGTNSDMRASQDGTVSYVTNWQLSFEGPYSQVKRFSKQFRQSPKK